MRRLDLIRGATLGASLWALGGCYSYMTVPPGGAKVGEHVRVRVSGAQAERLEPVIGLTDRRIEGDLLEQADTTIALGVALPLPSANTPIGERAQQRIVISRAELQDFELRRFDKLRTSLLVGGAVAAAIAIAVAKGSTLLGNGGSGGSPNENRVPRGLAIPIFKWSVAGPVRPD